MILPLRKLHRRLFIALSIALPVAFAIGINGRRPVPVAISLPDEIAIAERGHVIHSVAALQSHCDQTNLLCVSTRQPLQEQICGR